MINNISIQGRLTATPELRHTQSGLAVTSFNIAVDRKYSKSEEKKTDFFKVTAWNNNAEFICKYFNKGEMIVVEGSLQTSSYTDNTGTKRTTVEILLSSAHFCGGSNNSNQGNSQSKQTLSRQGFDTGADFEDVPIDDDLPF